MTMPESNVPDHPFTGNTLTLRDGVLDIRIRRPYSFDHDRCTLRSASSLNTQPEHSEDSSRNDSEVGEVVSERGANCD